jgi:hypothetical protein
MSFLANGKSGKEIHFFAFFLHETVWPVLREISKGISLLSENG